MAPRFAIIEFEQHHEVLAYLHQVLSSVGSVELYVSSALSVPSGASVFRYPGDTSADRLAFLRKEASRIKTADLILVTTVGLDSVWLATLLSLGRPVVVVVHNVNYSLSRETPWPREVVDAIRRLKWTFQGRWPRRRLPTEQIAGLVFASTRQLDHARALGYEGRALSLPWAICDPWPRTSSPAARLRVVIPGKVRYQDRRWEPVISAFAKTTRPCDLVLAGILLDGGGREIARQLETSLPEGSKLITYRDALSGEEYEEAIRQADVLLLPLSQAMRFATVDEIGGVTKVSGTEQDQLRHAKWALVDAAYRGNPALSALQLPYEDAETLAHLLHDFPRAQVPPSPHLASARMHIALWESFIVAILQEHQSRTAHV